MFNNHTCCCTCQPGPCNSSNTGCTTSAAQASQLLQQAARRRRCCKTILHCTCHDTACEPYWCNLLRRLRTCQAITCVTRLTPATAARQVRCRAHLAAGGPIQAGGQTPCYSAFCCRRILASTRPARCQAACDARICFQVHCCYRQANSFTHVLQVMSTSLRHRQATDRSGQVGSAQGSTTNPVPVDEPYNTLCGMQTTNKTLCRKARSECIAGKGDAAGLGRQPPP